MYVYNLKLMFIKLLSDFFRTRVVVFSPRSVLATPGPATAEWWIRVFGNLDLERIQFLGSSDTPDKFRFIISEFLFKIWTFIRKWTTFLKKKNCPFFVIFIVKAGHSWYQTKGIRYGWGRGRGRGLNWRPLFQGGQCYGHQNRRKPRAWVKSTKFRRPASGVRRMKFSAPQNYTDLHRRRIGLTEMPNAERRIGLTETLSTFQGERKRYFNSTISKTFLWSGKHCKS